MRRRRSNGSHVGHRSPAHDDLAGIGHEQPVDQLEDRALACAAAADEGERLALLHVEIEALQDVGLTPSEPNPAEGDFGQGNQTRTVTTAFITMTRWHDAHEGQRSASD